MRTAEIISDDCAVRFLDALKAYMKAENIGPVELARRHRISRASISRWQAGNRRIFSKTALRVSQTLGLDAGWIFQGRVFRGRHLGGETAAIEKLLKHYRNVKAQGYQNEICEVVEDIGMATMRYLHGRGIPCKLHIERAPAAHQVNVVIDDPEAVFMPVILFIIPGASALLYEIHCGDLANSQRYQHGDFCVSALRSAADWVMQAIRNKRSGRSGVSASTLRSQFEIALANQYKQ